MRTFLVLAGFGILAYSGYLWMLETGKLSATGSDPVTSAANTEDVSRVLSFELGPPTDSPFRKASPRQDSSGADELEALLRQPEEPVVTLESNDPLASRSAMAKPPPSLWKQTYFSAQRRPIETLRLGAGKQRTLVVGSLHGDEPLAIEIVERLAEYLSTTPSETRTTALLFVRTPNPDGLARHTRTNCRGVDLNRNFPSRDFRVLPAQRTGPRPQSEVETQIVRRILYDFRPRRVVHIKSTREARGWVLHNRRTQVTAAGLARLLNLRMHSLQRTWMPGSLESYSTDRLGLEVITVAVPSNADAGAVWQKYREPLLSAVIFEETSGRQRRINGWQVVPDKSAGEKSARVDAVLTGELEDSNHNLSSTQPRPTTPNREPPSLPLGRYIELPPAP